jgi:hypothetical protein
MYLDNLNSQNIYLSIVLHIYISMCSLNADQSVLDVLF